MNMIEMEVAQPVESLSVCETGHDGYLTLHYVNPETSGKWHKFADVFERGLDKMTAHYGVDMRELMKQHFPETYYNAIRC